MREWIGAAVCTLWLIAGSACWWAFYVQPNDEHQAAVAECVMQMQGEGPQAAWTTCHNRLLPEAGSLVQVFHPHK